MRPERVAFCRCGRTQFGGGTLPGASFPSVTLDLRPADPAPNVSELAAKLRHGSPPVVGCMAAGWLKLDLRTVLPEQDDALLRAVTSALGLPC